MWKIKNKDFIFVVVIILVLFNLSYFGLGPLLGRTIQHESPVAVLAQDPFSYITATRITLEQEQYATSYYKTCQGIPNLLSYHPPVIIELGGMTGFALNMPAYDSIIIIMGIVFILCALMYLLILSKFNKKIAMLSSPFFILLFSIPFLITLLFGEYGNISGTFFLLAAVYSLFLWKDKDKAWIITAILMSAIMMTHGVEMLFFTIIYAAFFGISFFDNKESRKKLLFKTVKLGALFLVISGFYMRVFYHLQVKTRTGYIGMATARHFVPPSEYARFNAVITDINWIIGIILVLGFVLFLYLLYTNFVVKKTSTYKKFFFAIVLLLVAITFSNYYSFGELYYRAFQQRNFWPIYFSVFFGLFFYIILKQFKILKDKKIFLGAVIVLMVLMNSLFFTMPAASSTVGKEEYMMIDWLEERIQNESVFFLYMPNFVNYDNLPFLPNWFFIRPLDKLKVGEDIEVMRGGLCDYNQKRVGLFGIEKFDEKLENQMRVNKSLCDFDYIAFSMRLSPRDEGYIPYINEYLGYINEKNMTKVYEKGNNIVLKNNPECMP